MALGDLYELTLQQEQRGQDVSNVFTLHQELEFVTTNPTKAQALAEGFAAQLLPDITSWQSVEVVTLGIHARNLYNPADDYTLELAIPGGNGAAAQTLPQFSAVGFSLGVESAAVGQGAKRFAGLTEEVQDDGVITNGTFIAQMDILADHMEGYVTVGLIIPDNVFRFVVVKRVRSGVSGAYSYRMPTTSAEGVFSAIIVATFNALITSQITRKIGLGS